MTGKHTFFRQIPKRLKPFLGNKTAIRRTLTTRFTDCSDTRALMPTPRFTKRLKAY